MSRRAIGIMALGLTGMLMVTTLNAMGKQSVKTESVVIRVSVGPNEKHPSFIAMRKFEEVVESRTSRKYDIQVFGNAQLGDDVKATQNVRMGDLGMVVTSSSPLTGMSKAFMVFDLPFLFKSEKEADFIFDGPIGKRIAQTLEPHNLKLIAYFENGFRQLTNNVRPITSPNDVRGLKIRTMENPIHLAAFRSLGANPTPMPFSEVFSALQQRTIDGQENPINTIHINKLNEVQKYLTITNHVYTPHIVLINAKLWDSFSSEEKEVFLAAGAEATKVSRNTGRSTETELLADLKKQGMIVTTLTPEQQKIFQEAMAVVYTQFEDPIGKNLLNDLRMELTKLK